MSRPELAPRVRRRCLWICAGSAALNAAIAGACVLFGIVPYIQMGIVAFYALSFVGFLLLTKKEDPYPFAFQNVAPGVYQMQLTAAQRASYQQTVLATYQSYAYALSGIHPAPPAVAERPEPVRGWRAYMFDLGLNMLRGAQTVWESSHLTAGCGGTGVENQPAAEHLRDGLCSCGIYGRASLWDIDFGSWVSLASSYNIAALCSAYGVVAVDDDGNWRASEVQIDALYVVGCTAPEATAAALRERYKVPVMVVASATEIPNAVLTPPAAPAGEGALT